MDEDGRFYLTGVVNGLVAAASGARSLSLVAVAAPHLDILAETTGEHVNLFVLAGDHAVCVDQVVGGLSTGGPTFRVTENDLPRLGAFGVHAARAISLALGQGPPQVPDGAPEDGRHDR